MNKVSAPPWCFKKISFLLLFFLLLPGVIFAQDIESDDIFTAAPLWRNAIGGVAIGRPVAQVESVVAATDGGNLVSFSSQGNPLWNFFAGSRITPYISRSREGTSYIGTVAGALIAVNRVGRELWRFNMGSPLTSPVLVGWDGRLFVFSGETITCMTASGYVLWSRRLESGLALAPFIDAAGGVIAVLQSGEVLRFDPFGNVFSHAPAAVPAAAASLRLGGGLAILLLYGDRRTELIYNFASGEPLAGTVNFPSPPVAAVGMNAVSRQGSGSEVAVLLQDGRMALISLKEETQGVSETQIVSEILWVAPSHISSGELSARPAPLQTELIFDDRGIYVITRSGATGFTADGRRLWLVQLRGAASVPAFGDDGILFSGGGDWVLNAYRLEDRIRAQQGALHGMLPPGNYQTANPGPSFWANYHFRFEEAALNARFAEIHRAARSGAVGAAEREYKAWLMEVSGSLLPNPLWPRTTSSRQPNILHRIQALQLLAYIGSRETIPFLTAVFNHDPEFLVRAQAAHTIGRIGVDPDGIAMTAFARAISPPNALRNEAALTAVAAAIGALCRFSGPPLSHIGIPLLTTLAGYYDMPRVQQQARYEIRRLMR